MEFIKSFKALETQAIEAFTTSQTKEELESARVEFLGRKGKLAELMSTIASVAASDRKDFGRAANEAKVTIEGAFLAAESRVKSSSAQSIVLDTTLPGTPSGRGHLHLSSQAIEEVTAIFRRLGFYRARHPEVDWDYYAFEALNMPKDHPARDDWETFFADDGKKRNGKLGRIVLTPHTSNGQVREMEKGKLPIRMISIGKCYRRQATARHLPMFHQFEGLMIDEAVSIVELRGVFDFFVKNFFGPDTQTRLRPYHFRFTEPSFELDISCSVCKGTAIFEGKKCKLCKGGWLELGGAGMVHPNVLKAGGLDPKKYTGFAFGWGLERTLMMRSGLNIDDIRTLYKNDLRFLTQF